MTSIKQASHIKQSYDRTIRTTLRLTEVERLIKSHRIIVPPLSRRTLANMCEKGIFETAGEGPSQLGWLVFEDSFWRWAEGLGSGKSV